MPVRSCTVCGEPIYVLFDDWTEDKEGWNKFCKACHKLRPDGFVVGSVGKILEKAREGEHEKMSMQVL